MPTPNPQAMEFLLSRRSRPSRSLQAPLPTRDELMPLLTAAARTPDHGKLEPWRFVVLDPKVLPRLVDLIDARGKALGIDPEKIAKNQSHFNGNSLAVAVIASPVPSEKIPEIEQIYSAGAVCLALLNACLASGWGANWLSGWSSHDRGFAEQGLGLAPHELIAGFIHIGTETTTPPERPRPDLGAKTTWMLK